jgi:integrase
VTFHTTRDSYISRLAPHVSVPVLMQLARHRNYSTTMRYLDFHDEALRSAVEKLAENQTGTGTLSGTNIRQSL